jgi:hypothetical protein
MDIFKNKIQYIPKYKLDLVIEPGYMIDFNTWIPANVPSDFIMPYADLSVKVSYDNQVLVNKQLSADNIVISESMIDDADAHTLQITMTGKSDLHTVLIKDTGQLAVAMIRIKLQIEELPINYALTDKMIYREEATGNVTNWSEFMGVNGCQTIEIETPIYPWLFKHEQLILEEFSFLVTGHNLGYNYRNFQ